MPAYVIGEAHVFNPEHTDERIVSALRGTHWIDVREIAERDG